MAKKKTENKTLPRERKSRAKYKCPDELFASLKIMAESFPPDYMFPDWAYDSPLGGNLLGGEEEFVASKEEIEEIEWSFNKLQTFVKAQTGLLKTLLLNTAWSKLGFPRKISHFPLTKDIVTNGQTVESFTAHMLQTIQLFFNNFIIIQNLAESLEENRAKNPQVELVTGFQIPVFVTRNSQNKLSVSVGSNILNTLNGLDADRLRICKICNRVFWAKRENSKTCSSRCLNVFNVRNSRALTDEEKAEKKLNGKQTENL
ncbi:MAG: hypothetical protein WKF71_04075 [Pyrinomonadaceae bacterium]